MYVKLVQVLFLFAWQRKRKKLHSKLKAKAIIPSCIFAFCEMAVRLARKANFFFVFKETKYSKNEDLGEVSSLATAND